MCRDGEETEGARFVLMADALQHPGLRQAKAAARNRLGQYDLAVLCAGAAELGLELAVCRFEAAAVTFGVKNPDDTVGRAFDGAHDPRLVAAVRQAGEARHGALATA